MKRYFLFLILFSLVGQLIAQEKFFTRTNILFIVSDDHSVPYLGCYGNPDLNTPNLDRLAKEGMRFNHMYTTASQCAPSRASIMAGRAVTDIQQTRFSSSLRKDIPIYPELLKQAGYYTGICGRSYHVDGSALKAAVTEEVFEKYNLVTFPRRLDYVRTGAKDEDVVREMATFLDQVPKGKPWFLQVNFYDPHRPFTAQAFEPDPSSLTLPPDMPDTKKLRADLAAHYGEIQHLDVNMGNVWKELADRGELDNTLIVFIGDNGSPLLRGKGTLWRRGLHVPFLAWWPKRIPKGVASEILVSGEDIGPTFLDVAGVDIHEEMTGKSFLHALEGKEKPIREYAYAARGSHGSGLPDNTGSFDLSRSVFNKEYKLIYNALWQLPFFPVDYSNQEFWFELVDMNQKGKLEKLQDSYLFTPKRAMFELYDLKADPNELHNLVGEQSYKEVENELKEVMQEWMILNWDYLPLPVPPIYD